MSELGQTDNPLELVPGNVSVVTQTMYELQRYAADLIEAGEGLRKIAQVDGWQGASADAFRERFHGQPAQWCIAGESFSDAATATDDYAWTLNWAQTEASTAIRLWRQGEAETDAARAAYERDVQAARESAERAGQPIDMPTFVDSGEAIRQQARETLARARSQAKQSADSAAARIRAAFEPAPPEPSIWDQIGAGLQWVGDFAQDLGIAAVNAAASVGNSIIHHPDEALALLGGLLMINAGVTGEVGGTALDVTGAGAVVGVPVNVASAGLVTGGAALTLAGGGALLSNAAGPDRVQILEARAAKPLADSPGTRGTPTDRAKEHLTQRDLDAARRELNGEVVKYRPDGKPYNHVAEVRETQTKLLHRIDVLKRMVGDTRLSDAEKAAAQSELSEASTLLDRSKHYVPKEK